MTALNSTKYIFKKSIIKILKQEQNLILDEAALPAYAHQNPLIDRIFWNRLSMALSMLPSSGITRILDFGCGTGVLSYHLAKNGFQVDAVDLNLTPKKRLEKEIKFPDLVSFHEGGLSAIPTNQKFDVIFALDVLEHIQDLDNYIHTFMQILNKNGRVIVSGPTENWFYKLGRKMAGARFTGDYHTSNIKTIKSSFSKRMDIISSQKIPWGITLFEIFAAQKRPGR